MEELERAKDRLLYAPCGADARQCLMFQVLGRRCGEADRRDGCSSAMYGIRIFFDALRECTRPERHSVGRVLERSGYRSRLLREPCIYTQQSEKCEGVAGVRGGDASDKCGPLNSTSFRVFFRFCICSGQVLSRSLAVPAETSAPKDPDHWTPQLTSTHILLRYK